MLRRGLLISRIATTYMVALGFNPMYEDKRALSRIATTDINREQLQIYTNPINISRGDATYIRTIIYVRWDLSQRYNIGRGDATFMCSA